MSTASVRGFMKLTISFFLWCDPLKKNEKVAARLLLCTYVVIRIINLGAYCFVP